MQESVESTSTAVDSPGPAEAGELALASYNMPILKTFNGHPKGLGVLFFTEFWERFSYYGMRALLVLFMVEATTGGGFGFTAQKANMIYGWYTSLVYAMAIPGGWIADRLIGQRRSILYGAIIIALGHFALAVHSMVFFYSGLALIIVGTGLLKPNISAIVGGLYPADQPGRRDAGFTIFYLGINLGALLSPLVCGYLGQQVNWHYGFAAAGVGMVLGIIVFIRGQKHFGSVGLHPNANDSASGANSKKVPFTPEEWKRIGAVFVLFIFATLFWAGFEQAGSSLNLFAERFTNNSILGWDMPSSFFQSVNPFFIIALTPVFAWLWSSRMSRVSSPMKFSWGLVLVGFGFLVMAGAALVSGTNGLLVSPMWLIVCYFLHTSGELCLSPIGLSTVTKLAPKRIVSLMMGLWFMSISLGSYLGGWTASFFELLPLPKLFFAVFVTTASAGVVLFILVKPIKKLMGGVQ